MLPRTSPWPLLALLPLLLAAPVAAQSIGPPELDFPIAQSYDAASPECDPSTGVTYPSNVHVVFSEITTSPSGPSMAPDPGAAVPLYSLRSALLALTGGAEPAIDAFTTAEDEFPEEGINDIEAIAVVNVRVEFTVSRNEGHQSPASLTYGTPLLYGMADVEDEYAGNGACGDLWGAHCEYGDRKPLAMLGDNPGVTAATSEAVATNVTGLDPCERNFKPLFFSVTGATAVLMGGTHSGATVYKFEDGVITVFADWQALGLRQDDDIDALSIDYRRPDEILFSLVRGSASIVDSPASSLFIQIGHGGLYLYDPAGGLSSWSYPWHLGLFPYDGLDPDTGADIDGVHVHDPRKPVAAGTSHNETTPDGFAPGTTGYVAGSTSLYFSLFVDGSQGGSDFRTYARDDESNVITVKSPPRLPEHEFAVFLHIGHADPCASYTFLQQPFMVKPPWDSTQDGVASVLLVASYAVQGLPVSHPPSAYPAIGGLTTPYSFELGAIPVPSRTEVTFNAILWDKWDNESPPQDWPDRLVETMAVTNIVELSIFDF